MGTRPQMSLTEMERMMSKQTESDCFIWRTYQSALSGIVANPHFFGPSFQGNAKAAHQFALEACVFAIGADHVEEADANPS